MIRVFILALSFILRLKFQNKPINIFERTSLRMARAWETIYIHIYYIYTYILCIHIAQYPCLAGKTSPISRVAVRETGVMGANSGFP